MAAFVCEFQTDSAPDPTRSKFLVEWGAALSGLGYGVQTQTEFGATYARRYSPAVFIVLYVILFPIGLLLILARPTQALTLTFEDDDGGATRIVASGTDNRVRRRLLAAGFVEGAWS